MRIGIIHLDLGLGGGERQTIDEALALKAAGHEITIITTSHVRDRCFPETLDPKYLGNCIEVYGDWIPRHIFGLFHALMSIFRMFWACLRVIWSDREFDIIFLDQVSYVIPLLKASVNINKVVFYCHHPDLLLSSRKDISFLKKIYRVFLDYSEQITTLSCDELLVNSKYTESIVLQTFPMLKKLEYLQPRVVYPAINTKQFKHIKSYKFGGKQSSNKKRVTFLSINRYERKKNIELAIQALNKLYKQLKLLGKSDVNPNYIKLIIAGGYDERLEENREYLNELVDLCQRLGLTFQFVTQPAFQPRKSMKFAKEEAQNAQNILNNSSNVDEQDEEEEEEDSNDNNTGDAIGNNGSQKRRKSIAEQVIGSIASTISATVSGGVEDDTEGNDSSFNDSEEEDSDYVDSSDDESEMGIAEFEELKKNGGKSAKQRPKKNRRESSRKSTINFLDNNLFKIDKNANVYFITKFPDQQKFELLQESVCVLYTPENEHFGIVPLEAMLAARPVIACKSGGPLETIVDGETGFLCESTDEAWCHAMKQFIDDKELSSKMGKQGRKRVLKNFSRNTLIKEMDKITKDVIDKKVQMPSSIKYQSWAILSVLFVSFVACAPSFFVLSRL